MKHKKIIIPSIVFIIAFTIWFSTPVTLLEKHSLTVDVPVEQLYDDSDLAIIATYSHERTEETWIDMFPLRNVATVNVLEVLKGEYKSNTLEIINDGEGVSFQNGYRMEVHIGAAKVQYSPDQKMILFFDYHEGHVLGDGYYLMGDKLGMFVIDGNENAIHIIPERSTTVQEIRDQLR